MTWTFDPFHPTRRPTRVVRIGDLLIGGSHPIAVQSMTTTDTLDVDDTVAQAIRLVDVGCEIVRITAPTIKAAKALADIKAKLRAKGVKVPLCADIHFQPAAAMEAVKHVEKVRVNPGNYVDSKAFREREYTDEQYAAEVRRVQDAFRPLVLEAKRRGVALRIGTNHGSLSDRIMNRWGDSPRGMVESALEFVRVCEAEGLRDVVFSMKSSNPKVMIQAYRLLAKHLAEEGMDHPFHLGVTEAGEGEDGRVKSAIGIGSLLMDGIGDTIRVSLTEDPCREIPVAKRLVALLGIVPASGTVPAVTSERRSAPALDSDVKPGTVPEAGTVPQAFDPYSYAHRRTERSGYGAKDEGANHVGRDVPVHIGGDSPVLALVALPPNWVRSPGALARLSRMAAARESNAPRLEGVLLPPSDSTVEDRVRAAVPNIAVVLKRDDDPAPTVEDRNPRVWRVDPDWHLSPADAVVWYRDFGREPADLRVVLHLTLPADPDDALLYGAAVAGSLLCDGIGDAVRFGGPHEPERLLEMVLGVLQACRLRASRTEYIACPGCGRTLFDLESTTQRIKARTGHLPGVKIAVMGCIVNGPGEMADADFGYVGSLPGFVNLYVGKDIVERNVPSKDADERLIALLKSHGVWREPAAVAAT